MTAHVRVRTRSLGAAVAAVLLAAGCGGDDPTAVEEAEDGIASVVAERLDDAGAEVDDVEVRCPDDAEIEAAATLRCDVVVDGADPVVVDLVVGAAGEVQLQRAVIPTAAAEAYLTGELTGPAEGPVEPNCGAAPLLVASIGDELRCEVVRASDGAVRTVVVTVLAVDGTVRYVVETPAPVAPPTPP